MHGIPFIGRNNTKKEGIVRQTPKIGELAKLNGATTKTIRYYELLGLLPKPERTDSGYRLYDEKDVERLSFIRKAKNLGFSLTDIGETLSLYDSQQAPCIHVLELLDRKIEEIDQLVGELQNLQQELMKLRKESAPRVSRDADGSPICNIIEQGIHAKGQVALTWLEGRQMAKARLERS